MFILPVSGKDLARFIKEASIPASVALRLFADKDAAISKAANCNFRFDSRATFTSPHAQTSVLGATMKGFAIGLRTGTQGDPRQQGGAWILCKDPSSPSGWATVWGHRDRHNADQTPLPLLFHLAGAPQEAYAHPRSLELEGAKA